MKWAIIVLVSISALVFPIKTSVSFYYQKGFNKVYFWVYLYFFKVFCGSIRLEKNSVAINAFGRDFKVKFIDLYKNRKKISFPKLMALTEASVSLQCGEGIEPARRLFLFSCLSNVFKALKPAIRRKYPYFKSKNSFIVDERTEDEYRVNVFVTVGFNVLSLVITALSKLIGVIFNGKDNSKQNRKAC